MKRLFGFMTFMTGIMLAATSVQSCSDDKDEVWPYPSNQPNAIVTVKPVAGTDSFYMQLDDSTRLTAANLKSSPFGDKEVRAFVNFRLAEQAYGTRLFRVYVNWMDSIRTKEMAASLGHDANVEKYGNDPVELLRNWTVSEDGYLTLDFLSDGGQGVTHYVNLVAENPDKPYEVTFYHKTEGPVTSGNQTRGIVAFRLDRLPDTGGKAVDLTVKWTSAGGERSVTFKYTTRKAAKSGQLVPVVSNSNVS